MKDEKWPWVQRAEGWKTKLLVSLLRVSFNFLVMTPLSLYVLSMGLNHQIKYAMAVDDLPSAWTLAWQILFCVYVEDVGFSIAHRLLHTPFLYKYVHKVHHQYTQTISIAAIHTHPVEFFIGNVIPAVLPTAILGSGVHVVTVWAWTSVRIAGTIANHSGYDLPWLPWDLMPMRSTPEYHDFHHSGGDFSGNFSG